MRKRNSTNHLLYILIIYTTLSLKRVRSEDFVVGDGDEWNSQANFLAWSEKYNFSVGDVLVFKYTKGQHNVFEVEEKTFRSCDSSSGVLIKYETGNDRVNLTEARRYWFICDIEGHCFGGMRFGIDVKQSNHSSDSSDSPSSQPNEETPSKSPPPATSSGYNLLSEFSGIGIFVMAIFVVTQIALAL